MQDWISINSGLLKDWTHCVIFGQHNNNAIHFGTSFNRSYLLGYFACVLRSFWPKCNLLIIWKGGCCNCTNQVYVMSYPGIIKGFDILQCPMCQSSGLHCIWPNSISMPSVFLRHNCILRYPREIVSWKRTNNKR